jgi:hypothetical protein
MNAYNMLMYSNLHNQFSLISSAKDVGNDKAFMPLQWTTVRRLGRIPTRLGGGTLRRSRNGGKRD